MGQAKGVSELLMSTFFLLKMFSKLFILLYIKMYKIFQMCGSPAPLTNEDVKLVTVGYYSA